jgi:hypothetical protein
MASFTSVEVAAISKMFFNDVFNSLGFQRAQAIVSSYRKSNNRPQPLSASIIAGRLATDHTLPTDIREFFAIYSSSTQSANRISAVEQMLISYKKFKLFNQYLKLRSKPSSELRDLLANAGLAPNQGQGWTTALLEYVRGQLQMEKNKLSNLLQETQCVHLLAAKFGGAGIFAFLPKGIINL